MREETKKEKWKTNIIFGALLIACMLFCATVYTIKFILYILKKSRRN